MQNYEEKKKKMIRESSQRKQHNMMEEVHIQLSFYHISERALNEKYIRRTKEIQSNRDPGNQQPNDT